MIEWLERVERNRLFLVTDERSWTYGETLVEVEARATSTPRLVRPDLSPEAVFDLMAGMAFGGATVVGPASTVVEPHDSPLVVFTSGTSGAPKGVRLTRANMEAAAGASAAHLGHTGDDVWLLAMPLHHVGGISIIVRQVWTGGAVHLLPIFEPRSFAAALGSVTMASTVPTMLLRILELGPFHGLRAVLVGGGPIPDGLLDRAVAVGLPVLPTYGMTETFGQVATLLPGEPVQRRAHPLPGIDIRIEGDGRIAVRGRQVSPGYVGEPDREGPWLVTNDLGVIDSDGALRVQGRADALIITGGEKVSPEQVESVIKGHPGVDDAVVVGVPSQEWGEEVVCLYVGTAMPAELDEFAPSRLEPFAVPKRWCRIDRIPTVGLGKPDRAAAARLCPGRER